MRILIVVHYFSPHIGGIEEVAKKQAESLVKAGHKVGIVTCRPSKGAPRHEERDGYTITRLRSLNFLDNLAGVTFPIISPFSLITFGRLLREYDIVHIHDVFYMSSHIGAYAALLFRKKLFVTQHVAMVDHPSWLVMTVQRVIYGTWGQFIFRRARRIVCYNTNVRDFLVSQRISNDKIKLQHNGIDITFFSPVNKEEKAALRAKYDLPADKPIALFVGRLVPKKGFDIAFNSHSPEWQTIIAGTGQLPAHMKLKHQDVTTIIFEHGTDQSQLLDLYRMSDVFVFPAIGEIWTLVMQEAMACGLPVVTTNDPAYKGYDVDEDLIKFVPRDSDSVKKAINEIIRSPSLQARMSAYSRQIVEERFSWDKNYQSELTIYSEENAK